MGPLHAFLTSMGIKKIGAITSLLLITLAIPITYSLVSKQQETRQKAAGTDDQIPTQQVCTEHPLDVVLVIDTSSSMTSTKLSKTREAAAKFVDLVSKNAQNYVSLVTFSNSAKALTPLTNNYEQVKRAISTLNASGNTCAECGILEANKEIAKQANDNKKKVVIFLTDGKANAIASHTTIDPFAPNPGSLDINQILTSVLRLTSVAEAEQKALDAAKKSYTSYKTTFYTIGLGNDVNATFLQNIAKNTGGTYYFSPTENQLSEIYQNISEVVGKGSVTGYVFHDKNGNKIQDGNEQRLSNWTVNIKNKTNGNTITSATSDSVGGFSIEKLCNGEYSIQQNMQTGWRTTIPQNNEYTVKIANADAHSDIIFGNTQASGSATTFINLSVILPGIGENGNTNPKHATRSALLKVFDKNNQEVLNQQIDLHFDGKVFQTVQSIDSQSESAPYYANIKLSNTLSKTIPGVFMLTPGTTTTLPTVTLTSGDMNNDNTLDIVDFNLFISCVGEKDCPSKDAANFNDDVKGTANTADIQPNVDGIDYNILLRSFASRQGN